MADLDKKYVKEISNQVVIGIKNTEQNCADSNSITGNSSDLQTTLNSVSASVDSRTRCGEQVIDMTSEEKREKPKNGGEKKQKKGPRGPPPPPGLKDDLTTIAHVCLVLYTLLMLYLCFCRPFEFFTWHPLLMSVGWMLMMTEGVLFISKENPVSRSLNRTYKVRYHWIALTISLVLVAIGFLVIIISKNNRNKEHFKSWHAITGLIALMGTIPSIFNGITALFDVELKNYIKPAINKVIHVASGKVSVLFGGISMILAVYTNWFVKASENNKYMFLLGFVTATYVTYWTVQRPLRKTLRHIFKFENV